MLNSTGIRYFEMQVTEKYDLKSLFGIFIILHLMIWTLIPTIIRNNLPMDSIEGAMWGHQFELGYDKNPFLNGWLTHLAVNISSYSPWSVYLFSQIFVVICLIAVWGLARQMLPPLYALASVLVLEAIQYFNFHAIDFNDNTLELGLWAAMAYFFYLALRKGATKYWILTGTLAALGVMAKYYTLAMIAGMGLFLLCHAENRKQLLTPAPYLGLLVCFAIMLPHILWLFGHDFITIEYVFDRAGHQNQWFYHFFFPAQFAWQQFQAFLPALILMLLLRLKKASPSFNLSQFDKQFLFYLGLLPFILTLVLALLCATKLRAGWGMPLQSLWGIILIASLKPYLNIKRFKMLYATILILMLGLAAGYSYSLINAKENSSANFPGSDIANTITAMWHTRFQTPLMYVAGNRWISGNISYYSTDHPAVYVDWDIKHSPWIDLVDLKRKGAVFVWNESDNEQIPRYVVKNYPKLVINSIVVKKTKIGIGFLAPEDNEYVSRGRANQSQ